MQGGTKGKILYIKRLSLVTTRILCFCVQSSLGRTTRTFWAATVRVPEENSYYLLFEHRTMGKALDKPWWRYKVEIGMVLVLFVGGNGKEQLLQPNRFRCCRMWGMGISTLGSRSKRKQIERGEKSHMVLEKHPHLGTSWRNLVSWHSHRRQQ